MEVLGKLLGSPARVKIMRLFLFNPEKGFELSEVSRRSRVPRAAARREIAFLRGIDFIRQRKITREAGKTKRKMSLKKVVAEGWFFNTEFDYGKPLRDLLVDSRFIERGEILKRFKNTGNIKLFIVSGIFIKNDETNIDLLIVGDGLKRSAIESTLKQLEAEIGKELRYSVLDTQEFSYRIDMYDKFIRDILDYPHERLIEKIAV